MRPALLLCCAFLLASSSARADGGRRAVPHHALRFVYKLGPGTKSCPPERTVKHLLMGAFGYDPIDPNGETGIEIDVTRRNGGFYAEILITGSDGTLLWAEEMDDPSRCMLLMRNAVVGAMIHTRIILEPPPSAPTPEAPPAAAVPSPPASTAPPSPAPPAPASSPQKRPAAPPAPPAPNRWAYRFGAGLEANVGLLPGLGAGGNAFVTRYTAGVSISGEIRMLGSMFPAYEGKRQIRGFFAGGSAVPCYLSKPMFLCGALHMGMRTVTADGYRPTGHFVFALGIRPGIEGTLGRFGVHGFVELSGIPTSSGTGRDFSKALAMAPVCGWVGFALSVHP